MTREQKEDHLRRCIKEAFGQPSSGQQEGLSRRSEDTIDEEDAKTGRLIRNQVMEGRGWTLG